MTLRIDWADHSAARHACTHWHYSKTLPAGALVKVGVWEDGRFVGVVLFSHGANNHIARPFKLEQTAVCELTRIAMRAHVTPVTRIVAIALRFLRQQSPGLRLVVSYADPEQGHHGGIYQGGGWLYVGRSSAQQAVLHRGKLMHKRTADSLFGTIKGMQKSAVLWKHKYLMPLDDAMRAQLAPLLKPYPKRAKTSRAEHPSAVGSANLTRALQTTEQGNG